MLRRRALPAAVDGLAALAVGVVVATMVLNTLPLHHLLGVSGTGEYGTQSYVPAIFVVSVAAVCFAAPRWLPDRFAHTGGWTMTTAGSAVVYGLLHVDGVDLGLAAAFGVCLGGVLAVLTTGSTPHVVAGGLALGLVTAPAARWLYVEAARQLDWAHHPYRLDVAVMAVLAVLAAVVGTRSPHHHRGEMPRDAEDPRRHRIPVSAVVAVVTGLAVAAEAARRAVVESVTYTPSGMVGDRRAEALEAFNTAAFVSIAVGVGLACVWCAYLCGRAAAARWVCVAFGLAVPAAFGLRLSFEYSPGASVLVVCVAVGALAAGAVLTSRADRIAPWDALGVLIAAFAFAMLPTSVELHLGSQTPAQVILAAGLGLGFGAGFSRLVALPGVPGNPLPVREVASVAALGFAAMVLAAYALSPVALLPLAERHVGKLPLTGPVIMVVTAVVLCLLFGAGRAVQRIRRDIYAEAAAVPQVVGATDDRQSGQARGGDV